MRFSFLLFQLQANTTLFQCTWKKCRVIHKTVEEIEEHVREAHIGYVENKLFVKHFHFSHSFQKVKTAAIFDNCESSNSIKFKDNQLMRLLMTVTWDIIELDCLNRKKCSTNTNTLNELNESDCTSAMHFDESVVRMCEYVLWYRMYVVHMAWVMNNSWTNGTSHHIVQSAQHIRTRKTMQFTSFTDFIYFYSIQRRCTMNLVTTIRIDSSVALSS